MVKEQTLADCLGRIPDPTDGRVRSVVFTDVGRQAFFERLARLDALANELSHVVGSRRIGGLQRTLIQLDGTLPLVVAGE